MHLEIAAHEFIQIDPAVYLKSQVLGLVGVALVLHLRTEQLAS